MASIVVSGFPNYLKRPGIVAALKKILKSDLIQDFWINEISEVYPDVLQANIAMCSVADASKAVDRLNKLPYYSKGCNYMLTAQVMITSERPQANQFAAPNNDSGFGQNHWHQAVDLGTPTSGPHTFGNGTRSGFDGSPQRNFNSGQPSGFDNDPQRNFNSGSTRRFDDVPPQRNFNSGLSQSGFDGPSRSGFDDGPTQRNFKSGPSRSGFDGDLRSGFDDSPSPRNFNSGGHTSRYDDGPPQRNLNSGVQRSGLDDGPSQRYNSGPTEYASPTQSNFIDVPPRRSHVDECPPPREFNSGALRSGFDDGSAQMNYKNGLQRSEFFDGRSQGNFVDAPSRRVFDEGASQRLYNDDRLNMQVQFNSQNEFSRRVVDSSQRQDFDAGSSRRIDDEPPRLDRPSESLKNANPSDLDMEIEILRKQRLIIEEERKLLLEQKKLELVKEFGPGALDGLNNLDDLEPGSSSYGSFGGPKNHYSGPRHPNAGPSRFSGSPKRFESGPKHYDSVPKRFGNGNRFDGGRGFDNKPDNNRKVPPPTNKDGKKILPMFFLPIKHVLEEMGPIMPQGITKKEKTALLAKIRIILRHRMNDVLQNLPHKRSNEIVQLYRQAHPNVGDKNWVKTLYANVKRKMHRIEISKFQGEVQKLKEAISKN